MYDTKIVAKSDAQLSLTSEGKTQTVSLYSQEGLEFLAALWVKAGTQFRLMYEPTWLGVPIIQFPTTMVMMQELIWKVRPDVIIECGLAHGGSAVLYASICELIGKGRVIGVDVEVRKFNRVMIQSHPLSSRIEIVEGSSIDPSTVQQVKKRAQGAKTVLVVLDSNHTKEHVLAEMNYYQELVTPGSYLVVMDGAQAHVWEIPSGKEEWRENHPLAAIRVFLPNHPEFVCDEYYNRMHVSACPEGFLRRRACEEMACG